MGNGEWRIGIALFAHFQLPHSPFPIPRNIRERKRRRLALPLNSIELQFALLLSVISNTADDIGGDAHNISPPWADIHAGIDSGILPVDDKRQDARVGYNGDDVLARRPAE
jgi:hypothetical protein